MSGISQGYNTDKKNTLTCQSDSTLIDELLEQFLKQAFRILLEFIRIVINFLLLIEH